MASSTPPSSLMFSASSPEMAMAVISGSEAAPAQSSATSSETPRHRERSPRLRQASREPAVPEAMVVSEGAIVPFQGETNTTVKEKGVRPFSEVPLRDVRHGSRDAAGSRAALRAPSLRVPTRAPAVHGAYLHG